VEAEGTPKVSEPTSGDEADVLDVETSEFGWSSAPSGRFSLDFARRWHQPTGSHDQDLFATLLVSWGGTDDRISGSIYGRGQRDLDGIGSRATALDDPLWNSWDSLGHAWSGQLFHAYCDLRNEPGQTFVRLGRQFVYEGQPFHFDGAKFSTKEGVLGLKASGFGGVPVSYFEDLVSGEWLAGVGLEARPWRPVRAAVVYAHIEEKTDFGGTESQGESIQSDLLIATVNARLWHWGTALVRYSAVDARTRDLLLRANVVMQRLDARASVSYYVQPMALDETDATLSPYRLNRAANEGLPNQPVQVAIRPFWRLELSAFKDFHAGDWRLGLGGRVTLRRLEDEADEGAYNHEYEVFWYGVEIEPPLPWHLSLSAGQMFWHSPGNDVDAFDAELRWTPVDAFDLRVGTTYSLFKYDLRYPTELTNPTLYPFERTDVQEVFLKLRWKTPWRVALRLGYAAEDEDGEWTHKMRLGWSLGF
jgi:hypothetical protein